MSEINNSIKKKIKEVDNFLSTKDFETLCSLQLNKDISKETGIKVYHNEINMDGVMKTTIDKSIVEKASGKFVVGVDDTCCFDVQV